MIWIIYIFEEVLILLINNPVIVKIAPRRPIKEIFSCRVKNAKIIVTTGIKYIPKEIFTVPTNLQALFQALKQNPLANNPKIKDFQHLKSFWIFVYFLKNLDLRSLNLLNLNLL